MNSEPKRTLLTSYLDDFSKRGDETLFAHYEGLRIRRWSYSEIAQTAAQVARELDARGIKKGDRVLFRARNSPGWVAAFFGCLLHGVIAVPIDVQSEHGFVLGVQSQVKPKLVFTDPSIGSIDATLPSINLTQLKDSLAHHSSSIYPTSDISTDDIVQVVFTSGTTAEPKGVSLTHRNILANLNPLEAETNRYLKWEPLVHPIRFLNLVPLSHVFGQLMGIFVPPLIRGTVFFQDSLLPSQIVETVKRKRISVIVCVPRILETLREKIERDYEARHQLDEFRRQLAASQKSHFIKSWWRFRHVHQLFGWKFWAFISGGATLNPDTEDFWQRLGFAVIQGYGMTETAAIVSVNHPFKKARGSIGKVLPGQEVKLDENGEILVRGENVSPGPWNGLPSIQQGNTWLHTGDAGEMDAAGNLYFKGRKKEVIVTSAGMNIYPEDIEAVLDRQPEIKMSAVIEIEGSHGPEPMAVLILRDSNASAIAAIERSNRSLAQHQQVRRWAMWHEADFPRTATLKVRKRVVAERMKKTLAASLTPVPFGAFERVVARVTGGAERPDASAQLGRDLKLDSLGRVELLSALEDCYHVDFDETAFTDATTLGEVEQIIREGKQEESEAYPYPRWQRRWPFNWIRIALFYLVVWPFTRVMGRPFIRGERNLRDVSGPLVFVCNHVTLADQALVMFALPRRIRSGLAIAMDGELLREMRYPPSSTNVFKRLVWKIEYFLVVLFFNVFSMPQKSGFRRSFAFAGELMDQGFSILVFPEGTRTEHGRMNPFRPGTGLLISQLNTTVVPLRVDGLWELKKANRHFAKAGEVMVTIGEPVTYSTQTAPQVIAADLETKVKAL